LIDANCSLVRCLVAPDIHIDEPEHPAKVIAGEYGISYVCHNITNRIMYSSPDDKTLVNSTLLLRGYGFIIKGHLGVYGQNKSEWLQRVTDCCGKFGVPKANSIRNSFRTQQEEIDLLHFRATGNNKEKAETITNELKTVDSNYLFATSRIFRSHKKREIDEATFHDRMERATIELIQQTEKIIGPEMARKIYGEYKHGQEAEKQVVKVLQKM
jgi:hypothetical protein